FGPVQPTMRKTRQVRRSVATVMPEVGHEEEPISPVRCDETVVKRNPIATMSSAPNKFHCKCSCGAIMIISRRAINPPMTNFSDNSRGTFAEKFDRGDENQIGKNAARAHDGTNPRPDDVTHA